MPEADPPDGWERRRPLVLLLLVLLLHLLLLSGVGAAPLDSLLRPRVTNITRLEDGDVFFISGGPCGVTRCLEAAGQALNQRPPGDEETVCACRCREHAPLFREDRINCANDIPECPLVKFGLGDADADVEGSDGRNGSRIPLVFLPHSGQIVHPSKEINFPGVESAVCGVSGAQFLTKTGWSTLRDGVEMDVPFSLYRDEGKTFLQWRGSEESRARLSGRLVLARLACRAELRLLTPCVAFRVAGSPPDTPPDVTEVWFSRSSEQPQSSDTPAQPLPSEGDGPPPDKSMAGAALALCGLLAVLLYAAAMLVYLRAKRRGEETEKVKFDDHGNMPNTKQNPLLSIESFLAEARVSAFDDGGTPTSSVNSSCSSSEISIKNDSKQIAEEKVVKQEQHKDTKGLSSVTVILHNQVSSQTQTQPQSLAKKGPAWRSESVAAERRPELHVAIVEAGDAAMEDARLLPSGPQRRKLYFNPAFFEPQFLKCPPPAAVEFLTKIREVIAIAKEKMLSKRFVPSLTPIPEEDFCAKFDFEAHFPYEAFATKHSVFSLKRENSRRKNFCSGCPGCTNMKFHKTYLRTLSEKEFCKSCVSSEFKQNIVKKWLEEVPVVESCKRSPLESYHNSIAKVIGTPKSIEPKVQIITENQDVHKVVKAKKDEGVLMSAKRNKRKTKQAPQPPSKNCIESVVHKSLLPTVENVSKKKEDEVVPSISPEVKQKMNAVINELEQFRKIDAIVPRASSPVAEVVTPFIPNLVLAMTPKIVIPLPHKFAQTNEPNVMPSDDREVLMKNINYRKANNFEVDSLERCSTKRRATLSSVDFNPADLNTGDRSNRRFSIIAMEKLEPMKKIYEMNSRLSRSYQEIDNLVDQTESMKDYKNQTRLNRDKMIGGNNSLVSEVYINDFGNTISSSDSDFSGSNQTFSVKYAEPITKPGQLVIEVSESPDLKKMAPTEDFDPDTLDRKPGKIKLYNDINISSSPTKTIEKICLKSPGSFKATVMTKSEENLLEEKPSGTRNKFYTLREIYEARNKVSKNANGEGNLRKSKINDNLFLSSLSYALSKTDATPSSKSASQPCLASLDSSIEAYPPPLPPKMVIGRRKENLWNRQNTFRVQLNTTDHSDNHSEESRSTGSLIKFSITKSEPYNSYCSSNIRYSDDSHLEKSRHNRTFTRFDNESLNFFRSEPEERPFISLGPNFETYKKSNEPDHECCRSMDTYEGQEFFGKLVQKVGKNNSLLSNMKRQSRRSRPKKIQSNKTHKTEDSGYLSSDSNESGHVNKFLLQVRDKVDTSKETVSDTDDFESVGDVRSESGGESIETNSVFFGSYRRLSLLNKEKQNELLEHAGDSGFQDVTRINNDKEHRSIISIVSPRGRLSALENL